MKILHLQKIILVTFAVLTVPLYSQAGIKSISMDSSFMQNQGQDSALDFVVNSQQLRNFADAHGNCAENPIKEGYEPQWHTDKEDFNHPYDDWHSSSHNGSPHIPKAGLFLAAAPSGGGGGGGGSGKGSTPFVNPPIPLEPPTAPPTGSVTPPTQEINNITPEPATLLFIGSAFAVFPMIRRYREQKDEK